MKKRIASIVLSVCLCFTLLPTAAFAEGESSLKTEYTQDISMYGSYSGGYKSVDYLDTYGWKWDQDTLTLTMNGLNLTSTIWFRQIYDTVNIVVEGDNKISGTINSAGGGFNITGSGKLTVDYISGVNGDITITDTTICTETSTSTSAIAGKKITVKNATLTLEKAAGSTTASLGLDSHYTGDETAITIENSTVSAGSFKCGVCIRNKRTSGDCGTISIDESSKSKMDAYVTTYSGGGAGSKAWIYGTVTNIGSAGEETVTVDKNAIWTCTNNSYSYFTVAQTSTLTNYGTIKINQSHIKIITGGSLINYGTINVADGNGIVMIQGTLENKSGGNITTSRLSVEGGTYLNEGIVNNSVDTWDALISAAASAPVGTTDFFELKLSQDCSHVQSGTSLIEGNRKVKLTGGDSVKTVTLTQEIENGMVAQIRDSVQMRLENLTLKLTNTDSIPYFHVMGGATMIIGDGVTFTATDGGINYIHLNLPTIYYQEGEPGGKLVIDTTLTSPLYVYVNTLEYSEDGEQNVPEGTVVATAGDGKTLSLDKIKLVEKVYDRSTGKASMQIADKDNNTQNKTTVWGQYLALSDDEKSVYLKTMYWPVLKDDTISAYGNAGKLSDLTIRATVTDQFGKVINGSWVWVDEDDTDISDTEFVAGTEYYVKFVPDEGERSEFYHIPLVEKVTPTLKQTPTLTLTPSNGSLSGGGTVTLTVGGLPSGASCTVTCDNTSYNPTEKNGAWSVTLPNTTADYTFTANFAGNDAYNSATATCTVSVTKYTAPVTPIPDPDPTPDVPSYVPTPTPNTGNTANKNDKTDKTDKTETVTNPDGSTTTTETKKDGTVIETTKKEDGSSTSVETKTDGTVTETDTTASGTTATTVTDDEGNVTESKVSVSTEDAKSDETVTLPVQDVKPTDSESAQEITVEIPEDTTVTVEIPVEDVTPGTVVIIVDEDGTETVVPTTKMTENGVSVTLEGNATIKIVENGKTFEDVNDSDYFEDAVAYASARGITDGTSEDTFSPNESCTRAQLVTFLWRAVGQPESNGESNMTDVAKDSYYTEAVTWAEEQGIVDGYGNGQFGSEDTITREQMAVILYRFAQNAGMDTTVEGDGTANFSDSDDISDYAQEAMNWAVNAGIMQGYENNLMPTAECTRAQIVTMLYRFLGK